MSDLQSFDTFDISSWLEPGALLHNHIPVALSVFKPPLSQKKIKPPGNQKPFFLEELWPKAKSFSTGHTFLFLEATMNIVSPSMFGEEFNNDYGTMCVNFLFLCEEKKYYIQFETFLDSNKGYSQKQVDNIKTAFTKYFTLME